MELLSRFPVLPAMESSRGQLYVKPDPSKGQSAGLRSAPPELLLPAQLSKTLSSNPRHSFPKTSR